MDVVLSIVMPVFNRIDLVKNMIFSILSQSYQSWELIIVDDGSDRKELEKLESFICNGNITLVRREENEPKGAPSCRNIGMKLSRGKYLIIVDSDDFIPSYCFQQRVDYMESHIDLDFAVFPYAEYEKELEKPLRLGGIRYYDDDFEAFFDRTLPFMVWSNIYRTESLINNDIFWDTSLKSFQDADYNIKALSKGLKYEYATTAKVDYYNRITNKGVSISQSVNSKEHFESHIKYFQNVKKVSIGYYSALRNSAIFLYCIMINNYSSNHINLLITECKYDKRLFYFLSFKDNIYRIFLKPLGLSKKISRWLLFPCYSIIRKKTLSSYQKEARRLLKDRLLFQ